MIETVVALIMFVNNEIAEYRYKSDMSECLKAKRIAERTRSYTRSYQCMLTKAELEKNIDGSISITKIILE
jgi:hypothetical protein